MLDSTGNKRENLIALSLILACSLCFVLGLFLLIKPKLSADSGDKGSKIVDSLTSDYVSVIALEGIIYDTNQSKSPFKTLLNYAYVKDELEKVLDDKHSKAVLLKMNSPGGTVSASQELYQLVSKIKNSGKPVVVSMGDVCASGCYYISSAADKIVANKGSLTGSIGVISQGINYLGLMQKLGLQDQTFKAGKYKDLGSGQRALSEEERKILQDLLNDSYDQFLSDIVSSRAIARDELEEKAQGLVYTGRQALGAKLVDKLGTYDDSKQVVQELLSKSGYKKAFSIEFVETWAKPKLSGFEDLLDLGLSSNFGSFVEKLGLGDLLGGFLNLGAAQEPVWDSKFKIMWLMN